MDTISEKSRQIRIVHTCDVCVIGGGCTGVFAAVSAARLGAKVAIVERQGFFGGVATAGLVNVWHSTFDTIGRREIITGLTTEVIERLKRRNAVIVGDATPGCHYLLNTEELKIELDELVAESRVRPFLHAYFASVVTHDGQPAAAIIEDKSGRRAIRASYFVDASGDGDLIERANLPWRKSRTLQPPTTCAIIRGLEELTKRNPAFALQSAVFDPALAGALTQGFLWSSQVPGSTDETMVAGTRVANADCSDADQLTRAEMAGRKQVRAICDIVRNNFSGGEAISLAALPACIGVRQTRQAKCLHCLTEAEVLTGKRFVDAIANGSYRVDVHHNDKPGITFRYLNGTERYIAADGTSTEGRWRGPVDEDPTFYQIPYSSLVPEGARNVVVAGRLLDADAGAYGAARVMVNCNQTGEAAGAGMYLALDANISVANVDSSKLREVMRRQGSTIV